MCKALELSNQLLSTLQEIDEEHNIYVNAISQYDLMTEDILHRIELSTFNACEGYKLAKQLQEIRRERRCFKDELETLTSLRMSINTTQIKNKIEKGKANVLKVELSNQKRFYRPRVIKDIMEKIK